MAGYTRKDRHADAYDPDNAHDDPDDPDYSLLLAEADKIRADSAVSVFKRDSILASQEMVDRANEITRGR